MCGKWHTASKGESVVNRFWRSLVTGGAIGAGVGIYMYMRGRRARRAAGKMTASMAGTMESARRAMAAAVGKAGRAVMRSDTAQALTSMTRRARIGNR